MCVKQTVVGDIIFATPVPATPSNKNTSNLSNLPTGTFSGPRETNSEKKNSETNGGKSSL